MKMQFSLEYRTAWGENVAVELTLERSRGPQLHRLATLDTQDGQHWQGEVHLAERDLTHIEYRYCIVRMGEVVRREWNAVPRRMNVDAHHHWLLPDHWRDIPQQAHLYSSACTRGAMQQADYYLPLFDQTLVFRVQAPQLREGQRLALVGNQPQTGGWDPRYAIPMERGGWCEWVLSLSAIGMFSPLEYKYVIQDEKGQLVEWEQGDNRLLTFQSLEHGQVLMRADDELHLPTEHWKAAGVVIPLFSLRSEGSQGVGDFGDLRQLVDWARETGMNVIQLLPIYDTTQTHTWTDSYPYNSISIYALHPMYIDLRQLPAMDYEDFMPRYQVVAQKLNELPKVDYELVNELKLAYLKGLYVKQGAEMMQSADYQQFQDRNADWLLPYATFCYLRDQYGTCDFSQWPEHSEYDRDDVMRLCSEQASHPGEIGFYMWVQYLLHNQLLATSQYARSQGVVLKGDIPIGISRTSVEAWVDPHLFHMNGQAGAPPDDFSADGQNWGFPTYNWERMAQDGYRWWIRRFGKMAEYFDAYRIDHVLGFFRIWEIPMHSVHGLLGQFSPSLPMTREEVERDWGLHFDEAYLEPLITDAILLDEFGADGARKVMRKYLDRQSDGHYTLKPQFATQRQVEAAYKRAKNPDPAIRDGVYRLISNVLFIRDARDPERVHPRISAPQDRYFQTLNRAEQDAFMRLYNHYYFERHNDFWHAEAMKKLPALVESTRMLVCAEDLGMVPACVGPVMDELKILSLEIQAMPKQLGVRFGRLEENPYRSVATIFTHDMATLRGWWEEDRERTQAYWNQMLQKDGPAPEQMPGWLCEEVIARHLYSPSMLCLISLQDWLSMDEKLRYPDPDAERINIPANPRHYWRYRMHLTLEELRGAQAFTEKVKGMIERR